MTSSSQTGEAFILLIIILISWFVFLFSNMIKYFSNAKNEKDNKGKNTVIGLFFLLLIVLSIVGIVYFINLK